MLRYIGDKLWDHAVSDNIILNKTPFLIGRASHADLVLPSLDVSRTHCNLSKIDDVAQVWEIECLSVNGLSVDGHRLKMSEKANLDEDNVIRLGENIYLLFKSYSFRPRSSIEVLAVRDGNPSINMDQNKTFNKIQSTTDTSTEEISKALQKQAKLKQKVENLQKRLCQAEKQAFVAETQNANLDREIKATKSLYTDNILKTEEMIAEVITTQSEADEKFTNLRKLVRRVEEQARATERKKSKLEENIRTALCLHAQELTNSKVDSVKAESKLTWLTRELTKIKEEKVHATSNLEAAQLKLTALESEILEHRAQCALKDNEIGVLRARLEEEIQANVVKTLENTQTTNSLNALQREATNLRLEIIGGVERHTHLSLEVEKYKGYWEETEQRNFATAQENINQAAEIAALKDQINNSAEAACAKRTKEFEEFVESDLQCAICFELVIAATALNCGHTFCNKCIRDWQARSANCPTCRLPIVSMQGCKMLDSFIARAASKLSDEFRERRADATGMRGTDSQGQAKKKKAKKDARLFARVRQPIFDLPRPEPVPEAQYFVDLT